MVTRTFLSKCTTIFEGSKDNFGLNPICMLNYGRLLSRCLLYFDIENIKNNIGLSDAKHILKLTNCGSIDQKTFDEMIISSDDKGVKERATSFEVVAFKIPEYWDAGRGFDNSTDLWLLGKNAPSTHGANWYNAYDGKQWGTEIAADGEIIPVQGILDIKKDYETFKVSGYTQDNSIISIQHFDRGNENLEIDITDYVSDILSENHPNFGIGLAFAPYLEELSTNYTQYVGFFSNTTNTFFRPYVESRNNLEVNDNRYSFHIGKMNKLYFYARLGGVLTDLEDLPVCTINGVEYPVKRQKQGIYYAEVKFKKNEIQGNTICYDTWSNLIFEREEMDEVEMEFVALPAENYFQIGESTINDKKIEPSLSGMNDHEKIYQGDEREIRVMFRVPYSNEYELLNDSFYRIYIKDGTREIDVIDWDKIDTMGIYNVFTIKSAELMPYEYHVDIKAKIGETVRVFKNKLIFTVIDNASSLKK